MGFPLSTFFLRGATAGPSVTELFCSLTGDLLPAGLERVFDAPQPETIMPERTTAIREIFFAADIISSYANFAPGNLWKIQSYPTNAFSEICSLPPKIRPDLSMSRFSHLHVHTQYSLLDGAAGIEALYKKAMADNMPALAITDHGNMFGAFKFVAEAYKHRQNPDDKKSPPKVKPIVGCEFYITENRHRKTFTKEEKDPRHHQILLAKNETGYRNLVKLTSLGYIEGHVQQVSPDRQGTDP